MNGLNISRFPGGGNEPADNRIKFYISFGHGTDLDVVFAVCVLDRQDQWQVVHFELSQDGKRKTIGVKDARWKPMLDAFKVNLAENPMRIAESLKRMLKQQREHAASRHWSYQQPEHVRLARVYKAELAKIAARTA